MTVHMLDTPYQLPVPDVDVIYTQRQDLRYQVESLGDIYLPVLGEALGGLLKELSATDKQALNALTLVPPALKSDGLQPLLEAVTALRDKTTDDAAEAIAELTRDLQSQMDESLSKVEQHALAFENSLTNFKAVTLSGVRLLIPPLEEEIKSLTASLETEEKARDKLLEDETMVNEVIADVEKINLVDKFKPLVASLETLVDIDPKNPLIGSIKAGLAGVGNILNLASDAIKYQDLINARGRLQEQVDALRQTITGWRDRRDTEALKLAQLQAVQGLDQPKTAYLQEIGKIADSLSRFVSNHRGATGDIIERASHFINHAATLGGYLNNIRSVWRS